VTRIALDAGYETHEAFTRAFRAMFDQPPSEFRQSRGWAQRLDDARVHFATDGRIDGFTPCTGDKTMEASIKNLPPRKVVFIRHVGPYVEVGVSWGKLCSWAGPRGLLGPGATMLGLSHDDPEVTPPDKLRYDACIVVPDDAPVQPEGEVGVQVIPGGDHAVTIHKGPYEQLKETYAALCGQWIPAHGREPRSAPSVEVYLNDPGQTAPEELLTEINIPLE